MPQSSGVDMHVQVHVLHQDGRLMDLLDSKLKLHGNELAEAQRVIHTALLCLQFSEEMRPPMSRVVNLLQGDAISESDVSPSDQSGVPVSGLRTIGSSVNMPWYGGLPSDSGNSHISSASDAKLIGIGSVSTSAR